MAKKADWIDGDRGRMAGMTLFNRVPTGTNKVMRVLRLELNNCTEKKHLMENYDYVKHTGNIFNLSLCQSAYHHLTDAADLST